MKKKHCEYGWSLIDRTTHNGNPWFLWGPPSPAGVDRLIFANRKTARNYKKEKGYGARVEVVRVSIREEKS